MTLLQLSAFVVLPILLSCGIAWIAIEKRSLQSKETAPRPGVDGNATRDPVEDRSFGPLEFAPGTKSRVETGTGGIQTLYENTERLRELEKTASRPDIYNS